MGSRPAARGATESPRRDPLIWAKSTWHPYPKTPELSFERTEISASPLRVTLIPGRNSRQQASRMVSAKRVFHESECNGHTISEATWRIVGKLEMWSALSHQWSLPGSRRTRKKPCTVRATARQMDRERLNGRKSPSVNMHGRHPPDDHARQR